MAYYNRRNLYNDKLNSFYNSAPRIILIQDDGTAVDVLSLSALIGFIETGSATEIISLEATLQTVDSGTGDESLQLLVDVQLSDSGTSATEVLAMSALIDLLESGDLVDTIDLSATLSTMETGIGSDSLQLTANVSLTDSGAFSELLDLIANMTVSDSGQAQEQSKVAKAFYIIDSNNVLQPLGVIVLNGKDGDLLPPVKEFREQIPGRHGDIVLGHDYKARIVELRVANSTEPEVREQLARAMARWLNPTMGAQPLIYAVDEKKTYYVRYAGKIPLDQWPNYMEFVIPLKMTDPIIVGSFEEQKTGSGVLSNEGNEEVALTIEVVGPITNPSITIGSSTLLYTGTINGGSQLIIDTGALTVELDGANAMTEYSGGFPKLPPGDTAVTASAQVTFKWRARWVG
ncbi:MAG: distal tail protein Dit [Carboxydocellales bacterium]